MSKALFKNIILWLLEAEARLILRKYRPKIIGITGNVGKTTAKEAVAAVLGAQYKVRKSDKSYNSEFGLPLTIIGSQSGWHSLTRWLAVLTEGASLILWRHNYPEWLVLEVGVDRPGDMDRTIKLARFDLVVVTALPAVPVHVEFFPSAKDLIAEKAKLPQSVRASGTVLLSADDPQVRALAPVMKAAVKTFGLLAGQARGSEVEIIYAGEEPSGLKFNFHYEDQNWPVQVEGMISQEQVPALLAGLLAGIVCGLTPAQAIEGLKTFQSPAGRLRVIKGIKQTIILDDTYNASPAALTIALNTLRRMQTPGRKIVVLGDMMELGAHTIQAHEEAGVEVARVADYLFTVGLRSKFIGEGAKAKRFPKEKMRHFSDAGEVGKFLQDEIKPADVILIKGSQSMRLERVVEEIMAEPQKKAELLVRQDADWLKR